MNINIYDERLLILADRLLEIGEDNKMKLKEFKFHSYRERKDCGYVGCALGECGYLFDEWCFNKGGDPVLKSFSYPSFTFTSSMRFFKLNRDDASHLFYPNSQSYNCEQLSNNATAAEVAYNIINFVERRI